MFERKLVWVVNATEGVDTAWASVADGRLTARGEISAQRPAPYSMRYTLETADHYATRTLHIEATTFEWARELDLRQEQGRWLVNGIPRPDLDGAVDCDIYACPLTNTMPILRHELHRRPGEVTFSMAFVKLPELAVVRSEQTYTHVRLRADGHAVVRYSSGDFQSDLVVDGDGFVVQYPKLGAIRITPE